MAYEFHVQVLRSAWERLPHFTFGRCRPMTFFSFFWGWFWVWYILTNNTRCGLGLVTTLRSIAAVLFTWALIYRPSASSGSSIRWKINGTSWTSPLALMALVFNFISFESKKVIDSERCNNVNKHRQWPWIWISGYGIYYLPPWINHHKIPHTLLSHSIISPCYRIQQ